jgi:hypothetical protein
MNYQHVAGALLFIAAAEVIMGIVTAEAIYPGYNVQADFGAYLMGQASPAGTRERVSQE